MVEEAKEKPLGTSIKRLFLCLSVSDFYLEESDFLVVAYHGFLRLSRREAL